MDPTIIALSIIGGFIGLIAGGELLVRGASNLAAALNVPPLVVGLTIVALGTSSPELAVTVQTCVAGKADLAVGNIVGSNLVNLMLILGTAAVVAPLAVSPQLFRLDVPVMIAAAAGLYALSLDGEVSRGDGLALMIASVVYVAWTIREARRETKTREGERDGITSQDIPPTTAVYARNALLIAVGLALLAVGADFTVAGAVAVAKLLGVSELVIGLTIVAVGTSLPEYVVSVLAAVRGKLDLAVGNVVGSNVLNILFILGLGAVLAPAGVAVSPTILAFDIPLMVAVSAFALPVFVTGRRVSRVEGVLMVALYAAYVAWLLYAPAALARSPISADLVGFVAPISLLLVLHVLATRKGTPA